MSKELINAIRAGYALFYIKSPEMDRAVETTMDAIKGIKNKEGENIYTPIVWDHEVGGGDPNGALEQLNTAEQRTILVAKNFQWYLENSIDGVDKDLVQFIQNRVKSWSETGSRKGLVIISNDSFSTAIPEMLQSEFLTISYPMPGKDEIKEILDYVIGSAESLPNYIKPTDDEYEAIIENSRGLTARGAANAITMAVVDGNGKIDPKRVGEIRAKDIEETSGLKVGKYNIGELLGYDKLKDFARSTVNNPNAKGIILLGPPGTGKTHFAKWLSTVTNKLMIEMDPSSLVGEGLYGQAENAWQAAIDRIKSFGPCILFIDEIEKALAGVNKNATGDTTGQRSTSKFLKFLSDERPPGVYVIATCNNIQGLPPEWVRAERWDCAPFYIGLPKKKERRAIFEHYLKEYELNDGNPYFETFDTNGWSGAELQSVCRLASMTGNLVTEVAEKYIVPVSITMEDDIKGLETWAKGKTINASAISLRSDGKRSVDL